MKDERMHLSTKKMGGISKHITKQRNSKLDISKLACHLQIPQNPFLSFSFFFPFSTFKLEYENVKESRTVSFFVFFCVSP